MFDVAPTELMLVAAVALVVIGPKDLPMAMRTVGRWVAKAQGVARHFRSGLDEMVRQAELEEMEKKWAEENARIMREHPFADPAPETTPAPVILPLAQPAAAEPFPSDPAPAVTPPAATLHSAADAMPADPAPRLAELPPPAPAEPLPPLDEPARARDASLPPPP